MRGRLLSVLVLAVAACGAPDPETILRQCEDRARAAQGPDADVTVGVNSADGPFFEGRISVTGDALAGRDPLVVYEECVIRRTGALPTRPPVLN